MPHTAPVSRTQAFVLGAALTVALLLAANALFAPRIGAPEGERVLALGPVVFSELSYRQDEHGTHHWERRANLPLLGVLVVLGGLVSTRLRRGRQARG